MTFKENNPDCLCCDQDSCICFQDDFDRADNDDLGSDWTEDAGDWDIASNKLKLATAAGGDSTVTTSGLTCTEDLYGMAVEATINSSGNGDELGLFIAGTSHTVEATIEMGFVGKVRIYYDGGLIYTSSSVGFTTSNDYTMYLCVDPATDTVVVTVDGNDYFISQANLEVDGEAGCVVKTAGGTITYDDFSVYETREDESCPRCAIECPCCASTKNEYIIDFGAGGLTDDVCNACDQLAGEFTVTRSEDDPCVFSYTEEPWCTDTTQGDCDCPEGTFDINLSITLTFLAGCEWRVVVLAQEGFSGGDEQECNPVSYFAQYSITAVDLDCLEDLPATLDKDSEINEEHGCTPPRKICGGSLPATITLKEP